MGTWQKFKWTIQDEAIHRGMNYADALEKEMAEAMRDGLAFHSVLKQAYQDGFLHGFEHKFDQTNYEQTDNLSESSSTEEKE